MQPASANDKRLRPGAEPLLRRSKRIIGERSGAGLP